MRGQGGEDSLSSQEQQCKTHRFQRQNLDHFFWSINLNGYADNNQWSGACTTVAKEIFNSIPCSYCLCAVGPGGILIAPEEKGRWNTLVLHMPGWKSSISISVKDETTFGKRAVNSISLSEAMQSLDDTDSAEAVEKFRRIYVG